MFYNCFGVEVDVSGEVEVEVEFEVRFKAPLRAAFAWSAAPSLG